MPQLDDFYNSNKATHIVDRNRVNPTSTLCGQPLEGAMYFKEEKNLFQASCKTCSKLYFGENG
jgi:hypothetical protein